jgi:hypothetical protein
MSEIKRQTAYKCSITQVLNSKYIQQQGLIPNYLDLNGIKVSRINLIAILVSKEGNVLIADDGTGQLQIMLFEDRLKKNLPTLGSLLLIIGRPREHNNKIFLVPEIIKELKNQKWLELRKKELKILNHGTPIIKEDTPTQFEPVKDEEIDNYHERIIKKIKELDKGEGAPYHEILNSLNIKNIEEKIQELIKEGELFEVKGKIKTL